VDPRAWLADVLAALLITRHRVSPNSCPGTGRQSSWSQQRLDRLPRGHHGVPRMVTGRQSLVNARKIMLQWL
jgi:hypothetical protein